MSLYAFFKDFAGPVATSFAAITAAIVTATFAYRQWKTSHIQAEIALDKLKFDVYEDRMKVLEATRSLVRLAMNVRPSDMPDLAEMQKQRRIIEDGRFLFSTSIRKHLTRLIDLSYDVIDINPGARAEPMTSVRREQMAIRMAAMKEVIREMPRLPEMLENDIAPNFLRNTAGIGVGSTQWSNTVYGSRIIACYAVIALMIFVVLFIFMLAVAGINV